MIRPPPRATRVRSSAASDVYKRQPEFRSWGAVPAAHFVDPMMRHLGHDYYVCLLSAAEIHGFSHQRPQVFQVMTPARLRARTFGRVRIAVSYTHLTLPTILRV